MVNFLNEKNFTNKRRQCFLDLSFTYRMNIIVTEAEFPLGLSYSSCRTLLPFDFSETCSIY